MPVTLNELCNDGNISPSPFILDITILKQWLMLSLFLLILLSQFTYIRLAIYHIGVITKNTYLPSLACQINIYFNYLLHAESLFNTNRPNSSCCVI